MALPQCPHAVASQHDASHLSEPETRARACARRVLGHCSMHAQGPPHGFSVTKRCSTLCSGAATSPVFFSPPQLVPRCCCCWLSPFHFPSSSSKPVFPQTFHLLTGASSVGRPVPQDQAVLSFPGTTGPLMSGHANTLYELSEWEMAAGFRGVPEVFHRAAESLWSFPINPPSF
ncbi:hypothetical protein TREES_T100014762 [Tupaia chinensis]|uniref:Uncharacterized protein n=1 Tax=Tupaia chinensis TaxID=246437 RepID=L9KUP3_TUPCH|nr:hypothetical protein TREES_T100014762 [Tupaia chinensis]